MNQLLVGGFACAFAVIATGCRGPDARPAVIGGFNAVAKTKLVSHGHGKIEPIAELQALRKKYDCACGAERTALRDQIITSMRIAIKHYHEATEDDVFEAASGLGVMFDVLGLGANTTGAVFAGETLKTVTNAVAGLLIGTRESLESNFLASNTKQAVLLMIEAQRTEKEARIINGMKLDDAEYSLDDALPELYDFFEAGSLRSAVTALVDAAQKKAAKAAEIKSKVSSPTAGHESDSTKLEANLTTN